MRKPTIQQYIQDFRTYVADSGHGFESCSLCLLVFSMVVDSFCLDLFGCFVLFVFPMCLMLSDVCIVCLSVRLETMK